MKSLHILIAVALVLTAAAAAKADFVLTGAQHMDVTTSHTQGLLFNASTADVLAGGHIESAYVNDEALLRVMRPSGSAIYTAWAYGTARIAVSSGNVTFLHAYDTSSVAISGGSVYGLDAYDTSSVAISGGSVEYLDPRDSSIVNISGGGVSTLHAYNTSGITLHGYDFRATAGLSLVGDEVIGTGLLAGKWFDGTSWIIEIYTHDAGAHIWAIPEPASALLLGFGAMFLARRRKQARQV